MPRLFPILTIASLAVASLAAPLRPAHAQGPYDGLWVIDAPHVGSRGEGAKCPALRLPFEIKDNQIVGSWEYVQIGPGIAIMETGNGRHAAAVTGSINPDGSFTAQWMSFRATGKVDGQQLEMRWASECGPRVATGRQDADLADLLINGARVNRLRAHQATAK